MWRQERRSPDPLGGPFLLSMMSRQSEGPCDWGCAYRERLEVLPLGPHSSGNEPLHPLCLRLLTTKLRWSSDHLTSQHGPDSS